MVEIVVFLPILMLRLGGGPQKTRRHALEGGGAGVRANATIPVPKEKKSSRARIAAAALPLDVSLTSLMSLLQNK